MVGGDVVGGDKVGRDKTTNEPAGKGTASRAVAWGGVAVAVAQLVLGLLLEAAGVDLPTAYWDAFRSVVGFAAGGSAVRLSDLLTAQDNA